MFLKLGASGKCVDCERIEKLKNEEKELYSNIEDLQSLEQKTKTDVTNLQVNRDKIYADLSAQAEKDTFERLENVLHEVEENQDALTKIKIEYDNLQKTITSNANKLLKLTTQVKSLKYSVTRYYSDENENPDKSILNLSIDETDELLSTTVKLKFNLMDIRELRKQYNKNALLIKDVLKKYQGRYTTKANMTIYRLMVIALEAELQNVLYNLSYAKLEQSLKNIKSMTAKYQKIASDGNQSISPTITKFIGEIEFLFIEAVKIEYEYYVQKERIKEEQRALRAQMKQEAAEKKILEDQRKKVEQEELKFQNEIELIKQQIIEQATDKIKIEQLETRLVKVQEQLNQVEEKKSEIINLQKGKAGYIYIISNLGSFGDSLFKVGMTRRLEPQERVDELGDASVPFPFDVHSFIFSENAPKLEYNLHVKLHEKRVNKINLRKEFFYSTIDEIENLVYELEPSAVFNKTMLAEQYYQSMTVNEIPNEVEIIDDENYIDDDADDDTNTD